MQLLPAFVGTPEVNTVYNVDALTLLRALPSACVDLILTDPPYGVHEMAWDTAPDLVPMFAEMNRVIHPLGAIVMTAQQPFATDCINANRKYFKYETIWHKTIAGDVFNAKNKPLRAHENILVFSKGITANGVQNTPNRMRYYPQGLVKVQSKNTRGGFNHIKPRENWKASYDVEWANYPQSVIDFSNSNQGSLHPNQKPVKLFEYLISTYTLSEMLVVDPFAGSGTTALAARNLNRNYIVGDITPQYVEVSRRRLAQPWTPMFAELTA